MGLSDLGPSKVLGVAVYCELSDGSKVKCTYSNVNQSNVEITYEVGETANITDRHGNITTILRGDPFINIRAQYRQSKYGLARNIELQDLEREGDD